MFCSRYIFLTIIKIPFSWMVLWLTFIHICTATYITLYLIDLPNCNYTLIHFPLLTISQKRIFSGKKRSKQWLLLRLQRFWKIVVLLPKHIKEQFFISFLFRPFFVFCFLNCLKSTYPHSNWQKRQNYILHIYYIYFYCENLICITIVWFHLAYSFK